MSQDQSEEKKHQATDVKLKKERDKGRIAKSADLYSATAALTGFAVMSLLIGTVLNHITNMFEAATMASTFKWGNGVNFATKIIIYEFTFAIFPIFCSVAFAVIIANLVYNRGIPISFDPIKPQFNRLNPVQGLKNIFGRKGMVGGAQILVRLTLWIGGSGVIMWLLFAELINLPICGETCFNQLGQSIALQLVTFACMILFLVALFDMPIQKALFLHDQKMGHSEKKREDKDVYGSPEIKGARKQIQREIAAESGSPKKIQQASIVVYGSDAAVAVHYDPGGERGPSIVKGAKGNNAQQLIEKARSEGVRMYNDDELAKKLVSVPAGSQVSQKHYESLALAMVKAGISL